MAKEGHYHERRKGRKTAGMPDIHYQLLAKNRRQQGAEKKCQPSGSDPIITIVKTN
ncbi:hypothetical protein [Rheinheimera sp. MMS21-TC3]|uniref:hypothetical protein n=1 Tax=Rheinheimera sp. MMS21-TC3 TaxID=3072790 RepID=UPI0028C508E7|nr:hypothetical protein [Rheinheimera sp. MMS21-TC3]WNO61014.1 hypothetical protein RDV63_08635 [Rheinheimera sp. MMS21-TC3]